MASPSALPARPVLWWLAPLLGALGGLVWAVYLTGGRPLLPGSIDWMLRGDWSSPLMGWLYSRTTPWSLPLGHVQGFVHPVGTSLAFTDATPWWSTLFKVLSPLLPPAFQVHGPWLATCFALQGLFGTLIVARFTPRRLAQVLGGLLFVLSPALSGRLGHASLCGHWLVLALLWLHLRPCLDARAASRSLGLAALFVTLAAGVHVYLAAMTLTLAWALLWRLGRTQRLLTGRQAAVWAGVLVGAALGVMALFGYFGRATTAALGFNDFSSNLLTFVIPDGMSRVVPSLPIGRNQYEGQAYLGLGVLLLGAGALGALLWRKRQTHEPVLAPGLGPLLVACGLMALFAFSARWQLAGWTVLSATRALEPVLGPLGRVFRSSGRFIWPLHYLVALGAIAGVLRVLRQRPAWAAAALGLAGVLQAAELPVEDCCRVHFQPPFQRSAEAEATWALAAGTYRHLALYPAQRDDGAGHACSELRTADELALLAWEAWRNGMTYNSGYIARLDSPAAVAACAREEAELRAGLVAPDTVYVVHARLEAHFRESTAGRTVCGRVEGQLVCVSKDSRGPFREALERHPEPEPR